MKRRYFGRIIQILFIFGAVVTFANINAQDLETLMPSVSNDTTERKNLEIIQNQQAKILQNIQRQIDLLKENLVDIISLEEVTNERTGYYQGKQAIKTTSTLSDYRTSYSKETAGVIHDCSSVAKILNPIEPPYILQEDRKVRSIIRSDNYKDNWAFVTTAIDQFYIDIARNSFVELIVPFDRQYEKCFDYKLLGVVKINDRNAYVIEVMGKESSREVKINTRDAFITEGDYVENGLLSKKEVRLLEDENIEEGRIIHFRDMETSWDIKFGGMALIDVETMEIFQFNRKKVFMEIINSEYQSDNGTLGFFDPHGNKFIHLGSGGKAIESGKYEKSSKPIKFSNGDLYFRVWNDKRFVYVRTDGMVREKDLFNGYLFSVQTEYDRVRIKDQLLTLPVVRTLGIYRRRIDLETYEFTEAADWNETYMTRYSNYKAFNIDTKIQFGTISESLDEKLPETDTYLRK